MSLKRITFLLFLLLLFSIVASAQQATKADIHVLETKITKLEVKITNFETTVREMDKRITTQIKVLFWAIGALIGLVLAVIALPQLLGYFQEKRSRTDFQKRIEELEQRVE